MGYGLSPWGQTWGDPVSGYTLGSVSVAAMLDVNSISMAPQLTVGAISASAPITATSISTTPEA